jgi:multiple sugar transport system ATP-binding protein
MASVTFKDAHRIYPETTRAAVKALDLEIEDGEIMVLVGPSGCGKSTSLRMLAGIEEVTSGSIHIGDRDVTHVPPKERDIAMVFQNYALYPHMTVADNMAFALKMAKVPKDERDRLVLEAARMLDLETYLDRKPRALSGGQLQRVAMGRAIVRQPQVFCMDEPLSNLDAKLRVSTRAHIVTLQQRLGVTMVYVTHDQVEAMTMGHRVAALKDGELQQVGTPLALYDKPANAFVAGFIGSPGMNLVEASISDGAAALGDYTMPLNRAIAAAAGGRATIGIRPESWRRVGSADHGLDVTVDLVEELGPDAFIYGHCASADEGPLPIVARVDPRSGLHRGDKTRIAADPAAVHVFDLQTGARIDS